MLAHISLVTGEPVEVEMRVRWSVGWIIGVVAAPLALACTRARDDVAAARQRWSAGAYVGTDSMGATPTHRSAVALHAPSELTENSGAAMSDRQPGVFFTINDSGHDPVLFALDTTGADRGWWRVDGATDDDWESIAMGPCAAPGAGHAGAPPPRGCVYVGDTGDNDANRPTRTIYRVAEPDADGARGRVRAEALTYRYPDTPHDVEAMYVAPSGDTFLITKRALAGAGGALRPALVYRLPASAWGARGAVAAALVDSLPIVPGSAAMRQITDASLAADGRHLAVRTYAQVYLFATDPRSGRVDHTVAPVVCNIVSLAEPQGEGVTWAGAGRRLVFTSEGATALLHLADCP